MKTTLKDTRGSAMNVRQSTLLRSLLDIEHFTPVAEFARMLGCSEKTVRTDVQAVNEHLELTSCGSISGHLVTIPYQIIKHIPTSALLEA